MATKKGSKKKAAKRPRKPIFADDPPIIVGGGGSTFIWINKTAAISFVADPTSIPHPPPRNPNNYIVLKVDVDISKVDADNGNGGAGNHQGHNAMNKNKFRTMFDA